MTLTIPGQVRQDAPRQYRASQTGLTEAISLRGVSMRFSGQAKPSVDRLDLTVPCGVIFGLLGPNGSGKTTTISMITGLRSPSRGTVQIFGHEPSQARRAMGVVPQKTALYERLSAEFNLTFHAWLHGYYGIQRRELVTAALELANLTGFARRPAGTLSGGMQRRLAIARALLPAPQLLILDEPTLGVDPAERSALWAHIRCLADGGMTVLLTTNVLEEAAALCDLVAILRQGRLAAEVDTPGQLQLRYGGQVITVRVAADDTQLHVAEAALRQIPSVTCAQITGDRNDEHLVHVTAGPREGITGQVIMLLARAGADIRDVSTRVPSLDEVFRELTGPHLVQP